MAGSKNFEEYLNRTVIDKVRLIDTSYELMYLSLKLLFGPHKTVGRLSYPRSQQLHSVLGHEHGVLELSRPRSIRGGGGPVVGPEHVPVAARVDHGLDREDMARQHGALGFVLGVMRHIRCGVEKATNAVTAVGGHYGELGGLSHVVDGLAQVSGRRRRQDRRRAVSTAWPSKILLNNTCTWFLDEPARWRRRGSRKRI